MVASGHGPEGEGNGSKDHLSTKEKEKLERTLDTAEKSKPGDKPGGKK